MSTIQSPAIPEKIGRADGKPIVTSRGPVNDTRTGVGALPVTVAASGLLKKPISLFPRGANSANITPPGYDVGAALAEIKEGKHRSKVDALRKAMRLGRADEVDRLKKLMPAVTWSAQFLNRRRENEPHTPSGILALDFDHLEDAAEIRDKIGKDAHVLAAWVTVRGKGVRVLVPIHPDAAHRESYFAARDYFKSTFSLEADEACKDVARLGFQACDPNIVINAGQIEVIGPAEPKESLNTPLIISVESMPSVESMDSMASMASMSQSGRKDRALAWKRYEKLPKSLRHVFDRCLIVRRVAAGERHHFLTKAIPALFEWVSCGVAQELLGLHYDMNKGIWRTTRQEHVTEIAAMMQDYGEKHLSRLNATERAKYAPLESEEERAAFRIARGLSKSPSEKKKDMPPAHFFLGFLDLGDRIGIHRQQAQRLMNDHVADGIVSLVTPGKQWVSGETPRATIWKWLL